MAVTSSSLRFGLLLASASGFLDAYTFLVRGGVFANGQTGNVVLMAVSLALGNWAQAVAHLWPILAFSVGIAIGTYVKRGRADAVLAYPVRWTVAVQVLVLVIVGFVPQSAPSAVVTLPLAFISALQFELFRSIGNLAYVTIATTGNLARWVEAAYGRVAREPDSGLGFRIYTYVVSAFAGGAIGGAFVSRSLGVWASWVPAALIGVALLLFLLDDRAERRRGSPSN